MEIIGITQEQFERVVNKVSFTRYDGNLKVADMRAISGKSCRGRVVAYTSSGPGTRRSWSGRRGPWACWHAFRDIFAEAFAQYPDARIRTGMASYTAGNFKATYPATGERNIGTMVRPAYMPELCDCGDDIRGEDA